MKDDGGNLRRDPKDNTNLRDWGFVLLKPEYRGLPAEEVAPATQESSTTAPSR